MFTLGLCIITSYTSFPLIFQLFMSRTNGCRNARLSFRYLPQYSYTEHVGSIKMLSFARHRQHYEITAAQERFPTQRDYHFLFCILLFQCPFLFLRLFSKLINLSLWNLDVHCFDYKISVLYLILS